MGNGILEHWESRTIELGEPKPPSMFGDVLSDGFEITAVSPRLARDGGRSVNARLGLHCLFN